MCNGFLVRLSRLQTHIELVVQVEADMQLVLEAIVQLIVVRLRADIRS